jgi:S-formylglutathione hydrolase FrmB
MIIILYPQRRESIRRLEAFRKIRILEFDKQGRGRKYMPGVVKGELASALMRRNMPYNIILPADRAEEYLHFPVLYLLHGLFGSFDNWTTLTGLVNYAAARRLIIVTPEGGDGWYTDSETAADEKYESYLIKELVPSIDANFRTIKDRAGRAVAGLSMGGYGALKFGIKYPKLFAMTASISGAFDCAERSDDRPGSGWNDLRHSVLQVFGEAGSKTRNENDLYKLVSELSADEISRLPSIYLDCGRGDGFLGANQKLAALFSKRKISHEYRELPGEHDWNYWDERVKHILKLAAEKLAAPRE